MKHLLYLLMLALPVVATAQNDSLAGAAQATRSLPSYKPGFALMFSAGSTGGGVAVGYSINRSVAVRVGANLFNYDGTLKSGKDTDDIQIGFDYSVKLKNADLMVYLYPFKRSGFRLTGGAYYNINTVTFFGKPTKDVKFNDTVFTIDEIGTLDGKADFNKVAPYVGLGFGNPYTRKRLKFMVDIGFFYQQSPLVTFKTTGMLEPSSDQGAVIQKNLEPLKYYPVVNLGLSYKL